VRDGTDYDMTLFLDGQEIVSYAHTRKDGAITGDNEVSHTTVSPMETLDFTFSRSTVTGECQVFISLISSWF
jgi:hypothetical protein